MDGASKPPESWSDREPTDGEVKAAVVLQAAFRGHSARKILNASKSGKSTHTHGKVSIQSEYSGSSFILHFQLYKTLSFKFRCRFRKATHEATFWVDKGSTSGEQ